MPLLRRELANPLVPNVAKDASANATDEQFQAGAATIRFIKAVTGSSVAHLKGWDILASGTTVGGNPPDFAWQFPASTTTTLVFMESVHEFSTALTMAATSAAGTSASSNPAQTFAVTVGWE